MKANKLLALAALCTTEAQAQDAQTTLRDALCATRALRSLTVLNEEGWIEAPNLPFLRFELVSLLSDNYALSLAPEIRGGKLSIAVRLDRFIDGRGLGSRQYEATLGDDDDHIEAEADQTVAELANLAKAKALELHARLIESVGVPSKAALNAAKRAWPKA